MLLVLFQLFRRHFRNADSSEGRKIQMSPMISRRRLGDQESAAEMPGLVTFPPLRSVLLSILVQVRSTPLSRLFILSA